MGRALMFYCIDVYTDEVVEESPFFHDCFKAGPRYVVVHEWVG